MTGLLALGASLSGCDPYACRYETRFVATAGSGSSAGIGTVVAEFVNFREYSMGEPTPSSLVWTIAAAQAVNQPVALSLRDGRDTTTIVTALPIGVSGNALSAGGLDITVAERERLFTLLSSEHGVVVVHANGVAGALLIPLTVTALEGWHRPSCD